MINPVSFKFYTKLDYLKYVCFEVNIIGYLI